MYVYMICSAPTDKQAIGVTDHKILCNGITTVTNLQPEEHLTTGGLKLQQVDTTRRALFHMFEFDVFRKDDQILQGNNFIASKPVHIQFCFSDYFIITRLLLVKWTGQGTKWNNEIQKYHSGDTR